MTSSPPSPNMENFPRPAPAAPAAGSSRTRNWCYTLNNYTDIEIAHLKTIICKYHIMGFEVAPDTGTPHIQGFIILKDARKFDELKRKLHCNAHIEKCKGSPWSNYEYCSKTGDFWETGERPKQPAADKQKATLKKYQDAVDLAKQGKIDEISPDLLMRHYGNILKLACKARGQKSLITWADDDMKHHFFWLYGPTGTGKSHLARELAERITPDREPYLKAWNKWWDGYENGDVVIMDEATPENAKYLNGYLKQWLDKWTFRPEIKGAHIPAIRPEWIIITSNYSIEDCFPAPADHEPLHRRLNAVYLDQRDPTLIDTLLPQQSTPSQQLDQLAQPTTEPPLSAHTTRGGNTTPPLCVCESTSSLPNLEIPIPDRPTVNELEHEDTPPRKRAKFIDETIDHWTHDPVLATLDQDSQH